MRLRGVRVAKFDIGGETKWGLVEARGELLVFYLINCRRLAPVFWSEFRRCVFDDRTPDLKVSELLPFVDQASAYVIALPPVGSYAGRLAVRSIGPVLEDEATIVLDGRLESVPVYQQPSGLTQFRAPISESTLLLAA